MEVRGFERRTHARPIGEINMIPLIDVMLVLLVIFIITAPLLTHAVKVDLPKAASAPNIAHPDNVHLSIDAAGRIYWNGAPVDQEEMKLRMSAAARLEPQPELHLHADRETRYQTLAEVMSAATTAGLVRIGFVSDPRR